MPSASALSMIGAPCVSSAQTKCTVVALHALEAHPDVGLDVLHDVADVERTVGVRQRGGDEEGAARHAAKTFDATGELSILAKAPTQ